ncbi:MAG TPA: 2OG-Fe(II) oxygenase [Pirellulaceae bacterium]|nr:2OG-Fe(II) oxygenase [Pirellulaceae bacterium]
MASPRESLQELLEALGESSQFVSSGSLPPVLPGLDVEGIGSVGTPVSAADAKRLISQATQAPYGRGEETILDTSVRRVWQLEPSQFRLENPEWEAHLAAIVDAVRQDFGIPRKVKAELYKLLIYEKGSFFAPHRDTEKTADMFATLVVCLPSRHAGGTLVVRHEGQTKRIDFGGKEGEFKTQYAAFYADCDHEIEPVTSGYRVCLVYNLTATGKQQPSAPQSAEAVNAAAGHLRSLFAGSPELDKIAIPFAHQYSEAGLDPAQLKGSDRARADVLVRAAESLDYACYFALLTHWQSGTPDYSTVDYDPWRRRNYWDDEDDEEEMDDDDGDDSGAEMEEVFDESLTADHWLDPQGKKQRFGMIHLEDEEILSEDDREGWSRRNEIEEATGNEGASMERWYRQGAIVLWPRKHTYRILAGEGQQVALPELEKKLARSKSPAALEDCRAFAAEIVANWQPRVQVPKGEWGYSQRMLKILDRLGSQELAERFVRDVLPKDFDGSEGKALLSLGKRFGFAPLGAALCVLVDQQKPDDYFTKLGPVVALSRALCSQPPAWTDERRTACLNLSEALARAIERFDKKPISPYGSGESRSGVVEAAIHTFAATGAEQRLDWFLAHVLSDPRRYDLREVLIPDVKAMHRWLGQVSAARAAADRLLAHCIAELRAATKEPIQPPQDWAREAELECRCEDCKALARFLRDPAARVGRFPLRKDRRQHLHQQIDANRCDCTHVTERRGSPQTLVCTKTQASYERRRKQYETDCQLLSELNALAGGSQTKPHLALAKRRTKGRSGVR